MRGAGAGRRLEINLFEEVLADITDIQVTGFAIKAVAPRVAQPVHPDLVPPARIADERVVRGDGVPLDVGTDLDAEDAPQPGPEVLAAAQWIVCRAAVAYAEAADWEPVEDLERFVYSEVSA